MFHSLQRPAFEQQAGGDEEAGGGQRVGALKPPGEAAAVAQHVPRTVRYRAAVAGADEAPGAEEIVGDGVGGAVGGVYGFEEVDGGGDAGGGGHT